MNSKIGALVMTALTVLYVVLLGDKGFILIASGRLAGIIMGSVLLVLPAVGLAGIALELRFGLRLERLSKTLLARGDYPEFNLDVRASGRATRVSADAEFERFSRATEAAPESWSAWFALGMAYDAAGDRRRARSAMRRAISLARANDAGAFQR
jgi:tetratricopeptide (TPR) repeat protein